MNEYKKKKRQGIKTAIIVSLLLLLVLGAVGGVCYSLLKPNSVSGEDTFKVVIDNFEFGHESASDGYSIVLSDKVKNEIKDNGYVEFIIELKDFSYDGALKWSFYNSSSEPVDSFEYATLSVSDDGLSATMKITSLESVEDGMFFFVVMNEDCSEGSFFSVWTFLPRVSLV